MLFYTLPPCFEFILISTLIAWSHFHHDRKHFYKVTAPCLMQMLVEDLHSRVMSNLHHKWEEGYAVSLLAECIEGVVQSCVVNLLASPIDLLYISFILLQRSLIAGRLARMDRNTSNTPWSTAICDSTAASRFEVLSPFTCIMLAAASRTAEEIIFSAYRSHARTSGFCMIVSRSAECLQNAS